MFNCCCVEGANTESAVIAVSPLENETAYAAATSSSTFSSRKEARSSAAASADASATAPAAAAARGAARVEAVREAWGAETTEGGRGHAFAVELRRGSGGGATPALGLALRHTHLAGYHIKGVMGGLVGAYNASASTESRQVEAHDFLIAVNGKTGLEEMAKEMWDQSNETVTLKVLKPKCMTMAVIKGGGPLGCQLAFYDTNCQLLEVQEVKNGVMADYNARAPAFQKVLRGDCIVSVNGVTGSVQPMLQNIKDNDRLELEILRCAAA